MIILYKYGQYFDNLIDQIECKVQTFSNFQGQGELLEGHGPLHRPTHVNSLLQAIRSCHSSQGHLQKIVTTLKSVPSESIKTVIGTCTKYLSEAI